MKMTAADVDRLSELLAELDALAAKGLRVESYTDLLPVIDGERVDHLRIEWHEPDGQYILTKALS